MNHFIHAFAVLNVGFGLFGILTPEYWYEFTPGVADTGPYNSHFVRDIGIAFVAGGFGLWLGVVSSSLKRLSGPAVAVTFFGCHALLHVYEVFARNLSAEAAVRDGLLVIVPALLAVGWFVSELKKQKTQQDIEEI